MTPGRRPAFCLHCTCYLYNNSMPYELVRKFPLSTLIMHWVDQVDRALSWSSWSCIALIKRFYTLLNMFESKVKFGLLYLLFKGMGSPNPVANNNMLPPAMPSPMPQLILASGQLVQGIQGAQLLIPTSQGEIMWRLAFSFNRNINDTGCDKMRMPCKYQFTRTWR